MTDNPFVTLKGDVDVFCLREEDKFRRKKAREESRMMKVWEKGKSGKMEQRTRASRLKNLLQEGSEKEEAIGEGNELGVQATMIRRLHNSLEVGKHDIATEKVAMADFISQKREMFLVQMSLDTKQEEIRKLEERTQLKEEALEKSEKMLEEDAIRFDTFLKENDKKAQDAMRMAEKATKRKMEKVHEIKKLNQQMQVIQSDINKHTEALEDCLRYKKFIDKLSPPEWFENQKNIKSDRQRRRRQERIKFRKEVWKEDQSQKIAEMETRAESAKVSSKSRTSRRRKEKQKMVHSADPALLGIVIEPDFEDEPLTSSDEETPMYFQSPRQLLEVFSALEAENLFLIQNIQESEQSLEQLRRKFKDSQKDMDNKSALLEESIDSLNERLQAEDDKKESLQNNEVQKERMSSNSTDDLSMSLGEKVKEIYQRCGFNDAGSTPGTLFMLSDIETRMEELLLNLEEIPDDYVKKAENQKEKKRRDLKRAHQHAAQLRLQEERNAKAIERSLQAPKKSSSRQVVYRSQPLARRKVQVRLQ